MRDVHSSALSALEEVKRSGISLRRSQAHFYLGRFFFNLSMFEEAQGNLLKYKEEKTQLTHRVGKTKNNAKQQFMEGLMSDIAKEIANPAELEKRKEIQR
jgi:hypothetical protein